MPGETDLNIILRSLKPELNKGEYVFCNIPDDLLPERTEVLGTFREKEGKTIIIDREEADRLHLTYTFVAARITLNIHSSLEGVGLTAAFSAALAKESISCNVVAAFYHDHIFVNTLDAGKAMEVLQELSRQ